MDKKSVIQTIHAYGNADSFLESEKKMRLNQLSLSASRLIFEELWIGWKQVVACADKQTLDRNKINSLIRRRWAIDKLATMQRAK